MLDYLCTGREPFEKILLRYPQEWAVTEGTIRVQENWRSILSISLVSKRLRELCLERVFGTIVLTKMKKIGQLWKLLEVNPRLGAFTHSCRLDYSCRLLEVKGSLSETLPLIFSSRLDSTHEREQALHEEAEEKRAEREASDHESENSDEARDAEAHIEEDLRLDLLVLKRDYATIGPDGTGFDEIIKGPGDLENALTAIFSRWNNLQNLEWISSQLPICSSTMKAIASHGTLKSLKIDMQACDEDFLSGLLSHSPPRE